MDDLFVEARDCGFEVIALSKEPFALLPQDVEPFLLRALLEVEGDILRERGDLDAAVAHALMGSTDKFSTAILTHLFCPLSARKSST